MGLVNPQQSNPGDTIEASDINTPVNQLAAVINGNIDSNNIADASVSSNKIADASVSPSKWTNPYHFRGFRDTTDWSAATSVNRVPLNAETTDPSTNFDISAGRFTATVAGTYHFYGVVRAACTAGAIYRSYLYKNGTIYSEGMSIVVGTSFDQSFNVSDDIDLAIGDYVELWFLNGGGSATNGRFGSSASYLTGHLITKA